MSPFSKGVPRLIVLLLAISALALVPPEVFSHGPSLCLWRDLFHLSACPSCGSTRALAAFFHGEFSAALGYNRNVVLTAPTLLSMLVLDCFRIFKKG